MARWSRRAFVPHPLDVAYQRLLPTQLIHPTFIYHLKTRGWAPLEEASKYTSHTSKYPHSFATMPAAALLRLGVRRVVPLTTGGRSLVRSVPTALQLGPQTWRSGLATESSAAKTARKPRTASAKTGTRAAKPTKAKAKAKAKPVKKAAKKPKAKKVEKAKPWEARGADGKLSESCMVKEILSSL